MPKVYEFNIVKIGMVFLLLSILSLELLQAQQNVRYRNQNRNELSQFAKLKHAKWVLDKRKADSLANGLSIPIYYVEKDSNMVVILQRLGPKNKPVYYATDNISAAATISVDDVWSGSNEYSSLTGEGVEINLWDGGAVRTTHQELQNGLGTRVVMRDLAIPLSNHSTHIAGTMIATGVNADAKGMAGKATIKAWDLNDDISEMSGEAAEGIVVSNHSYGSFCGWMYNSTNESWYWYGDPEISATEDYEFGFYNQTSSDLDYIAHLAPDYLIVKSAGNDRNESPTSSFVHYVWDETWKLVNVEREQDGGTDGFDCLTPMAVAKNILTVGAVDDAKAITSFTAYGPTDDGRIKPDVVANGANVISSVSSADNSYGSYNGTSMATASATGSVALLHQLQNTLRPNVQLRSSTIKGLLIHTASDLGSIGPDYRFGWGLLNIKEASDLIYTNSHNQGKNIHEAVLTNDEEIIIPVSTQSAPFLKITLCWTDPAALASWPSLNSRSSKLVNDLDVLVENSDNHQNYMPWILNVENPGVAATQDINHIDNVEQVYITNPGDNKFNIKISHSGSLSGGSQNFSLIISGIETTSNIFPPKNLTYTINESTISLKWDSPDSGAPESYKIYKNGTLLTETVNPTYNDQSIVLDNIYEYYVTALYELNNEEFESIGTNLITVYPQTLRPLPFIVDFENESTEVIIKNNEFGWRWGDSESLNSNFLNFSENTTKFIGIDSYSAGDAVHVSDIAITAPLRLADYSDIILSFDFLFVTDFYDVINELHVVYKLQEEEEWHELRNLERTYGWKHISMELPNEMCKNGTQIGFYYDDLDQLGIGAGLDNIQIAGTLNNLDDISIQSINSPENSLCLQESSLNLSIVMNNSGSTVIPLGDTFQITSSCNGIQKNNNYVLTQQLNPEESLTIPFQNLIDPLPVDTHELMVEVFWKHDQNSSNNTMSKNIVVNALPEIIFENPMNRICVNGAPVDLIATPSGGTFSGPSIVDNLFDPTIAGIGINEITYTYQDINGCSNATSITIEVVPLPVVSFTGLSAQYCTNGDASLLIGVPPDGIFSGTGITGNYFDPKIAGAGTHLISYVYTDENGCSNTIQQETTVISPTALTITGLQDAYCQNDDTINLAALPDGGIFYIDGIEAEQLIQEQHSVGTVEITYSYLDENSCASSISKSVSILGLPQVSIDGLEEMYCLIDSNISLSGFPEGGVFSGNILDGNVFNPLLADTGIHNITYTFEDNSGCINADTITTEVLPPPEVSFTGLSAQYCTNGDASLLIGVPPDGIFSGAGITGYYFDPEIAGTGTHLISYVYTDENGCSNTAQQETTVISPTALTITGLQDAYCQNDDTINLTALPDGGIFYIDGIEAEKLIPEQHSVGTVEITYSYLDENSCASSISKSITILGLPQVSIDGLEEMYCLIDSNISLSGFPEGGVFTLEGVEVTTLNPAVLGDGNYHLEYTAQDDYGCIGNVTQALSVDSVPQLAIPNIKSIYCPNETSIVLTGSPEGGYFKLDGWIKEILDPSQLAPGEHIVSYFYELNGCESSASISTWITEATPVEIIGLEAAYCPEDSLQNVYGQPDGGLFTTEPIFTESAQIQSFELFYTYTDTNKCAFVDSDTFSILPEPELDLPSNVSITLLDTVTLEIDRDDQYYVWPNDSISKTVQFIGTMMQNGENIIPLTVENIFGCKTYYDFAVSVSWPTEVLNASNQDEIVLFPNPASNELSVLLRGSNPFDDNLSICIHDLNGKIMPNLNLNLVQENECIIDVKDLPAGIYLIAISSNGLCYNAKFAVNR